LKKINLTKVNDEDKVSIKRLKKPNREAVTKCKLLLHPMMASETIYSFDLDEKTSNKMEEIKF